MEHDDSNNNISNGLEESVVYNDDCNDKHEKEQIIDAVYESLRRLCGGDDKKKEDENELRTLAHSSVSFSNGDKKKKIVKKQNCGKPHNIEIRIALTYFHRYRPRHSKKTKTKKKKLQPNYYDSQTSSSCTYNNNNNHPQNTPITTNNNNNNNNNDNDNKMSSLTTADLSRGGGKEQGVLQIVSDLGLSRSIDSPFQLANFILLEMEDILEGTGMDIQVSKPSGIICITTKKRSQYLRTVLNKLPCPYCTKWTNSIKGLWWHQQLEHNIHHSSAVDNAITEKDKLNNHRSLIIYQTPPTITTITTSSKRTKKEQNRTTLQTLLTSSEETTFDKNNQNEQLMDIPTGPLLEATEDPIEIVKENNLVLLEKVLKRNDIDATTYMDKNGASLLHWAAGCGHVAIVKYLIEVCKVNVNQKQMGKRSFRNRTALHWAARNGHLTVLHYLFNLPSSDCYTPALIDATTIDGTTAFCWASWQGHIHILK